MLRKIGTVFVLSLTCLTGITACSAAKVSTEASDSRTHEAKLTIQETCALLDELSTQHSSRQERQIADMALMAKNTQPMIEFLETTIFIFDEVAGQTGDNSMRAALLASSNNFQLILDVFRSHKSDDSILSAELKAVERRLDPTSMPYLKASCPGSIVNPNTDEQ